MGRGNPADRRSHPHHATTPPGGWPEGGNVADRWHDCTDCGDTIFVGEHIYQTDDGQVRCAVCKVKARNAPAATGPANVSAALDAACFSVYLHGNWRWLTRSMATEEREAFADAADRHRGTWLGDPGVPVPRWWRDDYPTEPR